MCGISGIFSLTKDEKLKQRINSMNDSIAHRGPDSSGIYIKKTIALGHRRLSIIDVRDVSNQPMSSSCNRFTIVFNGEIYNFKEIKEKISYKFKTSSDTEVILAAIKENGLDWFLKIANGMFSIAVYDLIDNSLTLVRDRLGIKPLYYFNDGANFIFSSEIKGILSSGLVEAIFEENAIDEYLSNRYVREPFTFFKNIYQIESGTILTINSKLETNEFKYWDLPKSFNQESSYNEIEILNKFQNEIEKAINYRLVSDVSLGTYLSGGLDSSIITAITSKSSKAAINTYTIGFKELNEFNYSKIVADKFNTNHHEIVITKEDYLNYWDKLICFKDSPLGVPNEIPLAKMSTELKEKITVVLSGEGADELMGGYGKIFRSPFDFYNNNNKHNNFYDYFISLYEYVPRDLRDNVLNSKNKFRQFFDQKISEDFQQNSNEYNVFNFFHRYHVKGLLQRVDTTTMQTSVEARVPFLDHNLIEFSYKKIPYNLKLKWKDNLSKEKAKKINSTEYSEILDSPKYLLKEVGRKYLPSKIIDRKKVGFPVPLNNWFGDLEVLANDVLLNAEWLKKGVLKDLIEKSKKEVRFGQILWMFINIQKFKNNYFEKEWRW